MGHVYETETELEDFFLGVLTAAIIGDPAIVSRCTGARKIPPAVSTVEF